MAKPLPSSSPPALRPPFLPSSSLPLFLGLALLVGLGYLAMAAWRYGGPGFPLDDAWIHQTYARNLARSGQLAFVPGVPSAGSTAPLWSLLLSLGYRLGLPFYGWTYGLGLLLLGLTGWTMARLGARLFPEQRRVGLWVGLACLFEWHLAWAAVSGMETILFVWLSAWLVERYLAGRSAAAPAWRDGGLGLLAGLLILTRPEGVGLAGLIGLDMAWRHYQQPGDLLRRWAGLAAGTGLVLAPYLAFHLAATGLPLPNTFYAKQAEYRVILAQFPLWWRLFGSLNAPETVQGVFRVVFIGGQFLLLPGLVYAAWLTWRERRTGLVLVWTWWIGYLVLYAIRLPVTYQHGRYQIPAIAWVILLGVGGTARLLADRPRRCLVRRVAGPALALATAASVLAFTAVGAGAYGRDISFINGQMVAAARWLAGHTAPGDLIVAHDIGAIGYFTERPLLDLAGLITPEVIPFIRDEAALLEFITRRQADYLVTFPSWYPELVRSPALRPVYQAGPVGEDGMTVYRITKP